MRLTATCGFRLITNLDRRGHHETPDRTRARRDICPAVVCLALRLQHHGRGRQGYPGRRVEDQGRGAREQEVLISVPPWRRLESSTAPGAVFVWTSPRTRRRDGNVPRSPR